MRKALSKSTALMLAALAAFAVGLTLIFSACGSDEEASGAEGGTLKASYSAFVDYLDPALAHSAESWTAVYNTYLPLLTYAHASGQAGTEVVPGLAKAMPEISEDGRTYTLSLRKGLKYSDGSPVKASDFKFSVERMFRLNSSGSFFYMDIVGAEDFAKTKQGGIDGIQADDKTGRITIELNDPRGPFVNELALPFVALVPANTPIEDQTATPPPATGPYAITKSEPGRGWEYERNPQWERTNAELLPDLPGGHVDRIEVSVIRNASSQVNDIESGALNWIGNAPPADRYAAVKDQYEGSQFRVEPTVSTEFFWFNTTRAPFDDVRVRQAVNHAVDGRALERIYAGQLRAAQQILPVGMPGHEEFELYPHDMVKAKELIAEANPADREVTVWADNESPTNEATEYFADVLGKLGFDVTLKKVNPDNYFPIIGNDATPDLDAGWASWFQDYPHPNDFFQPLLSEESIEPNGGTNLARFADPKLSATIDRLAEAQMSPELEAEYAELDREFMENAPWVPYGSSTYPTFVSSDIELDEVIFNPTFSQDLTSFRFK